MNVRDALNRAYNLVGTAIVAISGFAFFPQTFSEDELTHKLDEGGLFLLAIGALIWYFVGKNKVSRTIVPILLAAAALIMKLLAFFFLEAGDSADLGDEYALLLLFALALGFLIWQYISLRRIEEKELVGAAGK
jgi:peptidoglycan/LPS O-acetylase OafA/YrhL